jgi:hypothetical protein
VIAAERRINRDVIFCVSLLVFGLDRANSASQEVGYGSNRAAVNFSDAKPITVR